jgi:hypothetical protein
VFRGSDELSFSSWALREARADDKRLVGVMSSAGTESVGRGSGSTGADGPFPTH